MVTEKRLIDANELLRDAEDYGPIKGGLADMYDVKWLVDAQFTVDAVEVKHGEWVVCGDGKYVPFMCSACGKTTSWYHKQTANYCPNCGAKMDGKSNVERKATIKESEIEFDYEAEDGR
jgi:predicted RNA-binding Zn-ribbon protein involved in translation (DUF1610 family)